MLDALDAVTAEDIQRVAQEIVDDGPYLAVIGPFDDADRFEKLLGLVPAERLPRLGDRLARVLDRGRVVRIPLAGPRAPARTTSSACSYSSASKYSQPRLFSSGPGQ